MLPDGCEGAALLATAMGVGRRAATAAGCWDGSTPARRAATDKTTRHGRSHGFTRLLVDAILWWRHHQRSLQQNHTRSPLTLTSFNVCALDILGKASFLLSFPPSARVRLEGPT